MNKTKPRGQTKPDKDQVVSNYVSDISDTSDLSDASGNISKGNTSVNPGPEIHSRPLPHKYHAVHTLQPVSQEDPATFNPQPATRNPQPATRNPQPTTCNPQPSTRNPQPTTRNLQPATRNPQPTTRNLQPATRNPQPATGKQPVANPLFPVFLKLENLQLLLVGGGNIALEKLGALLGNSPAANIRLIAREITPAVMEILHTRHIPFEERAFLPEDASGVDLAVIAINDHNASALIHAACKEKGVLTNVADTPALCDFYLSSVVQKGNLKIAISTNGKSPTIAKRVKEVLNDSFPEEMEDVLGNMEKIRNTLTGDFSEKVRQLNAITQNLTLKNTGKKVKEKKAYYREFTYILAFIAAAIFFMLAGYFLIPLLFHN